jgi:uncharacterized protein (TIGR02145 family)
MKHLIFIVFSIYFSQSIVQSQTITNVVAKQEGNNIVITYNLQCESDAEISLYVSENGDGSFVGPLKSLTGDVGNRITPGNKTIVWNTLQERDFITGDNILFRVKGIGRFDKFTDSRDRKTYKTVRIGNQIWMAVNLAYKEENGCIVFKNKENNLASRGYLYTWEKAKNGCPTGWHLPSDTEWKTLNIFLGGDSIAGGKLKEVGTVSWRKPNEGATNESGFTALPGGANYAKVNFCTDYTSDGNWWSATEADDANSWCRTIRYDSGVFERRLSLKETYFSVRCIKDK